MGTLLGGYLLLTIPTLVYNIFHMSAINDFLIKSAGMEKEANKAFQKLLKRGINPYDILNIIPSDSSTTVANRGNAAFRDLTTPLKDRRSYSYRRGPYPANPFDLVDEYKNYLNRVVQNSKDTRIVNFLKYTRKKNALDRFAPRGHIQLPDVLGPVQFSTAFAVEPPALPKKYKVKTPYATTHHLADPEASLQANARALETPNDVTHIENPAPERGWNNWRSTQFRVNRPGQRWTEDEMKQMLTSNNLSGTPLYETVFNRGTKEFPTPLAAYVADTPEVRKVLNIPESVKSVPIADVQDPLVDFVYKGTEASRVGVTPEKLYNGLRDGLRNTAPERYRKNGAIDVVLSYWADAMGIPQHAALGLNQPRWFAPAAKTSAGYIDAADKNFIRLDADTLARYRELMADRSDILSTSIRDAFGELSESQLSDLIRSSLRENRMDKLRKAYEGRIAATGLQKPVHDVLSYAVNGGY